MARLRPALLFVFAAFALALGARYALEARTSLWALDAQTGRVSWIQDIDATPPIDTLAAHNGTLFWAGQQKGPDHRVTFAALDSASGAQRWSRTLDGRVLLDKNVEAYAAADALVVNSLPIRGAFAPTLDAFGAQDGAQRWSVALGERSWIAPAAPGSALLHLLDTTGAVNVINVANGSLTLVAPPANPAEVIGNGGQTIVAHSDALYGFHQNRYVLRQYGKDVLATLPITRGGIIVTPRAIFGLDDAGINIFALDPASGAPRWQRTLPPAPTAGAAASSLEAAADTPSGSVAMLVSAQETAPDRLIAFDTQGATLWQAELPHGRFRYALRLFVSGKVVLIRNTDMLRAYNAADGAELWTKTFDNLYSTDAFDASNGHYIAINNAPRWRQLLFYFGIRPGA